MVALSARFTYVHKWTHTQVLTPHAETCIASIYIRPVRYYDNIVIAIISLLLRFAAYYHDNCYKDYNRVQVRQVYTEQRKIIIII